jgi:hypothetical protein
MYELMQLSGALRGYQTPSGPVRQFADAMNGCHENIAKQPSFEVYTSLAAAIHHQAATQRRQIEDVNWELSIKELAKLTYDVITRLQNAENQLVVLQGTRNGAWIAFFFVWLYPRGVEVLVRRVRVYPTPAQQGPDEDNLIRLSIRLEEPLSNEHDGRWAIQHWTATGGSVPVMFDSDLASQESMDSRRQHSSPLKCARDQISAAISAPAVDAVGHLAAALVEVVTQSGHLFNKRCTAAQPLMELCSYEWLKSYTAIMARFGWENLDETRRKRTVEVLLARFADGTSYWDGRSGLDVLGSKITHACRHYSETYGKAMLLDGRDAASESGEEGVIEHAIHIAAEALLLAFCAEIPRNLFYRPLEPFKLRENADMLCGLLRRPEGKGQTAPQHSYTFWEFRKRSIEILVPGAAVIESGDLAVASNGYVAYSAALAEWDKELTDRRSIAALHRAPGPLKAIGVEGKLARLTEDSRNALVAGRIIDTHPSRITLFEEEECCLDERAARNKLDAKNVHFWKTDGAAGPQTMHVATYVQVSAPQRMIIQVSGLGDPKVPASWEQSIDAVAFAIHVEPRYTSQLQLKLLACEWERRGYLGDNLRWCAVGRAVNGKRCVTATSENEKLRFFEAGSLADSRRVFIRHRTVSLFGCIKSAMESCRDDEDWVIIA